MLNHLWQTEPSPNPDLLPADVVKLQLDAIQNNDLTPNNDGIRIAFKFASPANQNMTGPLVRFIKLVKNPIYRPLIGFESAELDAIRFVGNLAQQRVHVYHRGGNVFTYVFTLSKQREGDYKDCWLTDGVLRE